jgi:protein-S-isoprenylcysteine O-methyltransferase Ste14
VRKLHALAGSTLFFVIAPGTVSGYLPWMITRWKMEPPFLHQQWSRAPGIVLLLAGLVPLVNSFWRFAMEGLGTPAPVAPPGHLIVSGFYRHVRNPMYVALVAIILGQALLFADIHLLWYGAGVWLGCHLFVVGYEEPALRRRFGDQYEAFRDNVPRWIPRMRAWQG